MLLLDISFLLLDEQDGALTVGSKAFLQDSMSGKLAEISTNMKQSQLVSALVPKHLSPTIPDIVLYTRGCFL